MNLPGLLSGHASSSRQLSLWVDCQRTGCRCNVMTRRAGGTAGCKISNLPEGLHTSRKMVTFYQFCDSRRLENLQKMFHYSLAPSWASVQTEGGSLHNILKNQIWDKWGVWNTVHLLLFSAGFSDWLQWEKYKNVLLFTAYWRGWQAGCIISAYTHLFADLYRGLDDTLLHRFSRTTEDTWLTVFLFCCLVVQHWCDTLHRLS